MGRAIPLEEFALDFARALASDVGHIRGEDGVLLAAALMHLIMAGQAGDGRDVSRWAGIAVTGVAACRAEARL